MVFGLPLHARRPGCAGVAWLLKGTVQGFGVQGLGFRVQGLGFETSFKKGYWEVLCSAGVQGSGFVSGFSEL